MHYTPSYISALCCSSLSDFHSCLSWQPSEADITSTKVARDWIGRCIIGEEFIPIQVLLQQGLMPKEAPSLDIALSENEELAVDAEFFPLCPM